MQELQNLDGVAYVRFASVLRQFRDVGEFLEGLKDFLSVSQKEEEDGHVRPAGRPPSKQG